MNVSQAIIQRQSCRNFDKTRQVERDKLVKVLQAGVCSPSARNAQPWQLTAVVGTKAQQIADICRTGGGNAFLQNCNTYIVVSMLPQGQPVHVEGLDMQDFRPMDIGMCIMQMCLVACELGLSSCIIGRLNFKRINEVIGQNNQPALVLALGYAASDDVLRPKNRRAFDDTVKIIED